MWDRASTFADDRVIALLREKFVPVAVDCWYLDRARDDAGEFYKKVVSQRQPFEPGKRSTQGFYAFAPDGTLLKGWNNRNVPRMREYLAEALKAFTPAEAGPAGADRDPRFARGLPDGAVVVLVPATPYGAAYGSVPNCCVAYWSAGGTEPYGAPYCSAGWTAP